MKGTRTRRQATGPEVAFSKVQLVEHASFNAVVDVLRASGAEANHLSFLHDDLKASCIFKEEEVRFVN